MSERARRAARALDEAGHTRRGTRVASAPGRVNLIGGHTDYNGGFVLPVAIDRRTAVAARPRDDDVLTARALDLDDRATADINDLRPHEEAGWFDYVAGVIDRLRERGHRPGGTDLAITGDVPMGAGVASSAALSVATTAAVGLAHDLGLDDEAIARAAWDAETEFVGVGCGLMDQFAATFAEAGRALFLDCRSAEFEGVPLGTERVAILVVDTGVQHDLVESAYNERVEQCEAGVEALEDVLDAPVAALRDVPAPAFEAHADALPETVRKRCRHVISENDRVRTAVEALRSGDLERVGELMGASHESLRVDYEVSCAELDLVVDIASRQDGVLGARMTGAGFGGSVVSLVRPDAVGTAAERIAEAYREETGIDPDVYACETADGWREVPREA